MRNAHESSFQSAAYGAILFILFVLLFSRVVYADISTSSPHQIGFWCPPYTETFVEGAYYQFATTTTFCTWQVGAIPPGVPPAPHYGGLFRGTIGSSTGFGNFMGFAPQAQLVMSVPVFSNPQQGDPFFAAVWEVRTGPAFEFDLPFFMNFFQNGSNSPPSNGWGVINWKWGEVPAQYEDCCSNVLFLPGIQGSRLYIPGLLTENKIWEPDSPFPLNNDVPNLDMTNLDTIDTVYTKENDIIDYAYGSFSIYAPFVLQMNALRVQGTINEWQPIAYDWRLNYQDLINYGNHTSEGKIYYRGANASTSTDPYIIQQLKHLASTSQTGKVTIIAHSNGGLLTKQLTETLGAEEIAQLVDKIIFVAVPQLGTPKAIGGLLHGYHQALPFEKFPLFLTPGDARALAQNIPTAYNLLPSNRYFTYTDDSVITFDPQALPGWRAQYSDAGNPSAGIHSGELLRNFMTDPGRGMPDASDVATPSVVEVGLFDNAATTHISLDDWTPSQGVQFITIAGWGNETLSSVEYTKEVIGCSVQGSGDCEEPIYGDQITFNPQFVIDGDDTVVEPSAHWANGVLPTRYWLNLMDYNSFIQKAGHANILGVPELETLLSGLITNSTSTLPQYISTSAPNYPGNQERLHFVLHSPLTLGFTDEQGNYSGSTATTTIFTIPGVNYERLGEVQWLSVPRNLPGQVIMRGIGSGCFTLDIREMNGNEALADTTFAAIPSSASTTVTFTVDPLQSPTANGTLVIDFNGDGEEDAFLPASQNGIVFPDTIPPEAVISVSTSTKDILVIGIDETSPTTVTKNATTTSITDASGNTTKLFFQKQFSKNILTYARMTGINYGTSTISLPSSFLYAWDSSKTPVSQTVIADKKFAIHALYNKKKDKTTIIVLEKNKQIQKVVLSGLRLIKLTTNRGTIEYSW